MIVLTSVEVRLLVLVCPCDAWAHESSPLGELIERLRGEMCQGRSHQQKATAPTEDVADLFFSEMN
jgi:hypothetical protein